MFSSFFTVLEKLVAQSNFSNLNQLVCSQSLCGYSILFFLTTDFEQYVTGISQPNVTGWGRRPAALRAVSHKLSKGFNEAVNGFTDEGWSMLESDSVDDVTLLVNSSPGKMMDINFSYSNGFLSMGNAVLCAKASMLLQ
ncbi:hypothetical protein Gotur_003438, partial [Gossypium turneri]